MGSGQLPTGPGCVTQVNPVSDLVRANESGGKILRFVAEVDVGVTPWDFKVIVEVKGTTTQNSNEQNNNLRFL